MVISEMLAHYTGLTEINCYEISLEAESYP